MMKLRFSIVLPLMLTLFFLSCSNKILGLGPEGDDQNRVFSKMRFHPCLKTEIENNTAKFCHRYCKDYKFLRKKVSPNCKEWETIIIDMNDKEMFQKIIDSEFILIKEVESL